MGKYKVLIKERGASGLEVLEWNTKWVPDKIKVTLPHALARLTKRDSEATKATVPSPAIAHFSR